PPPLNPPIPPNPPPLNGRPPRKEPPPPPMGKDCCAPPPPRPKPPKRPWAAVGFVPSVARKPQPTTVAASHGCLTRIEVLLGDNGAVPPPGGIRGGTHDRELGPRGSAPPN